MVSNQVRFTNAGGAHTNPFINVFTRIEKLLCHKLIAETVKFCALSSNVVTPSMMIMIMIMMLFMMFMMMIMINVDDNSYCYHDNDNDNDNDNDEIMMVI